MSGTRTKQYITVFLLLILVNACSTEKNTLITRTYHNITSRYNIFYNGFESFNKGVRKAEESIEDDYTRILPIFTYSDEQVAQTVGPDMDRAIKKATKVITLHSITVKPEFKNGPQSPRQKELYEKNEYNVYVERNYLMMGKAYLYKHDYELAEETFQHILTEYHYSDIVFETQIWLARLYIEKEEYKQAELVLNNLTISDDIPKKIRADLYATLADHQLKQEKYERAIEYLTRSYETVRRKYRRIRYAFILGQLHQELDQPVQASEYYEQVIKMNPPYEMSFTARVNRASVYTSGSGSLEELTSELMKMLKDEKNYEYRDQIYYALGNIYFKEGMIDEAIANYQLSSATSITNRQQKTTSCLKLAETFYERHRYELAQAYYDTATMNMNPDYPGYTDIMVLAGSLSKLVQHLMIINFEDSVQRLAAMDEKDRLAIIDTIIAQLVEAERFARESESAARQSQQYNRMMLNQANRPGSVAGNQGGKWYFYNQAAKSFGQPEFRMKWGNRKLEDNWRRQNKAAVSFAENQEVVDDSLKAAVEETRILDDKTREYYLQDIPLNDSMMEISNEKLMEARFNAGVVYKNDLEDLEKSNEQFEILLADYPGSDHTLPSYYNLYINHTNLGNAGRADYFKSQIISDFPDSPIARLLTDPDYIQELEAKENEENIFYERIYEKYNNGMYQEVMIDVDTALNRYPDSDLIPKYLFLKVLSIGATQDRMTFSLALDSLAKTFPGDVVGQQAEDILAFIKDYDPEVKTETQKIEAEEIFTFDTSGVHYYAMVVPGSIDINQLKFEVINFNLDYYPQLDFEVVNEPVDSGDQLVLVKAFEDIDEAWEYHDTIVIADNVNSLMAGTGYERFIISDENTTTLLGDKVSNKYVLFFSKHYSREATSANHE